MTRPAAPRAAVTIRPDGTFGLVDDYEANLAARADARDQAADDALDALTATVDAVLAELEPYEQLDPDDPDLDRPWRPDRKPVILRRVAALRHERDTPAAARPRESHARRPGHRRKAAPRGPPSPDDPEPAPAAARAAVAEEWLRILRERDPSRSWEVAS